MRLGLQEDAALIRTRDAFIEIRGADAVPAREAAIAALESKLWGKRNIRVFRMRCDGDFGRGPHDLFVPERVLWALIDLRHFVCPYHR
jgi:hypothetical protein